MVRSRRFRPLASLLSLGLLVACTKPAAPVTPPSGDAAETKPAFENPGGMWMPSQLASHAAQLKELGVEFEPAALTDPTAFPLAAIVSLGGCSASFVSGQGLIVTNHHCVTGELQHNSTEGNNLLVNGYVAKSRADELAGGPGARVYVTSGFEDVTARVQEGLEAIEDDAARSAAIAAKRGELATACMAGKPDTRCEVVSYFDGAQFFQIEQLEIRDVRLVYAPHAGVGVFGGEVDNWQWPRHTGDFSFLRAYVGPDGKPADPSADNVPYQPPHHLKIATTPLQPGEFAMVAGYPGITYRLQTAAEVREAVSWRYPRDIERYDANIALYTELGAARPELQIKAASRMRGLNNYRKNFQGMLDGLVGGGLADRKAALENELRAWIDADPARKTKFGGVLPAMDALAQQREGYRDHDSAVQEITRASQLLRIADALHDVTVGHPSGEPADPRRVAEARRRIEGFANSYDPQLDAAVLGLALRRAAALPEGQRPTAVIDGLLGSAGKVPLDDAKVDQALAKLFARSKLADPATQAKLLQSNPKKLAASTDPVLKAYGRIRAALDQVEAHARAYDGAMSKWRPLYIEALQQFSPEPVAPDANGTLRVSYGTVRGYTPKGRSEPYLPFTTMSEMVAKHTGTEPFILPPPVLEAAKAKRFGPYFDARIGDLPVDFLADLDITGGNSGSATLNGRGELIGLAFDGNYESIASDWLFIPEVTRSIHCDIRFALWMMDAVDGADHLLVEMGVTPAIDANTPASPVGAAAVPAAATASP
jgi:hypothetical protein